MTALNMDEMYREFQGKVLSLIQNKLRGDRETAEELTGEVFLKACKSRDSYDSSMSFKNWIYKIAKNVVIDHRRSLSVRPETIVTDDWFEIRDDRCTPEQEALRIDQMAQLIDGMTELTKPRAQAIELLLFHGLNYEEISKELRVSVASVKTLLHRAKATLHKKARKS